MDGGDRFTAPIDWASYELKNQHFDALLDACRTVSGRNFNWDTRVWDFPMMRLEAFKTAVEESNAPVEVLDRQVRGRAEFQLRVQERPDSQFAVTVCRFSKDWQRWMPGAYCKILPPVFRQFGDNFGSSDWNGDEKVWTFSPMKCGLLSQSTHASWTSKEEHLAADEPVIDTNDMTTEEAEDGRQDEVQQRMRTCLEPHPWSRLRQFQQEGVEGCLRRGGRCLLADEMGCGKTVQAIAVAACYTEHWPLLIITPSIMRLTWAEALATWLPPHIQPDILSIATGQDIKKHVETLQRPGHSSIVIISYDLVQKMEHLAKWFPFVICDESHALKGHTTNRTRFVVPLVKKARRALLLSGTPALSRPIELYPQIDALYPGLVGTFDEFGHKFCGGPPIEMRPGVRVYRGCSRKEELAVLLKGKLMIRRLKKDVLKQLPAKNRRNIPISPDSASLKEVRALKKEQAQVDAMDDGPDKDFHGERVINELYRASGEAKAAEVLKHVISLQEAGQKQLVFAHHKSVLDLLEQGFRKQKLKWMRIDGTTPDAARQKAMAKFQSTKSLDIALLSIKAASVGLTLTEASVIVFAELAWVPGDLIQAEDRAHRIGQEKCVEVLYLRAKGTIDDIIWPNVKTKLRNVGDILDGNDEGTAQGLAFTQAEQGSSFATNLGMSKTASAYEVVSPGCDKGDLRPSDATELPGLDLATPAPRDRKCSRKQNAFAESIETEAEAQAGMVQMSQSTFQAQIKDEELDAISLTGAPFPQTQCRTRLFHTGGPVSRLANEEAVIDMTF
ncbi:hypothetical protein WJX84_007577 [Apatococcus fuscideae]|uniref:SWI/SNF-related matrix-associated actin-dependent regulator of chromatin subfamily A-like protein 1 n=1 Tax=Apatococcus fuscideae TaxID=2026836 RepID=A0AAW1TDL5_9CHLO